MGKKTVTFLLLLILCFMNLASCAETVIPDGQPQLEDILSSYAGKEAVLSGRLQIIRDGVNFREAPGGKVLGRLQGGTVLDCLDETQDQGALWYYARSAEYGCGYVVCTFAKPVWNELDWWPLPAAGDVVSDNMLLFAYWMGTYQLDHGLSVIETAGTEKLLSIAPAAVRGNASLIPGDMKIQLVSKLFEYGLICRSPAYDRLRDPSVSSEEKNGIAVSVLQKHYGTDDIWKIITGQSIVLFIHQNDLHAMPEGPVSGRDQMLMHAVMDRLIEEH